MVAESKRAAINRYDEKTYRKVNIRLRIEDDAEIIKDMDSALADGVSRREWLKGIYERCNAIVRCKDCVSYQPSIDGCDSYCQVDNCCVGDDDFCSFAERR